MTRAQKYKRTLHVRRATAHEEPMLKTYLSST